MRMPRDSPFTKVQLASQEALYAALPLAGGHLACALAENIVEQTVHLAMKGHKRIATEATSSEAAAPEG